MKRYIAIYMRAHGYKCGDFIPCEDCGATAVDVHHKKGRIGKDADLPENLIAVCRRCHQKRHGEGGGEA